MNLSSKKRVLVLSAYLGSAVSGLAFLAASADAQTLAASVSPSQSVTAPATQGTDSMTDEELRQRVQAALHSAPYFYDQHVNVSVENGVVALRGFVFSDWDLRDAMRIASRAAGERQVVDDLSIEVGGRH
jgi:osmotically-inducible protein OsmY